MDSERYAQAAVRLFDEGYNCAQAALVPFSAALGLDEATAKRLASSLGGGIGVGGTCGAALGMLLAMGPLQGYDTAEAEAKAAHSARVRAAMQGFADAFGATDCPTLRGADRTACRAYVRYAAERIEALLSDTSTGA